nr:MAG TPA: hypothetical protein [Caudoviricetes sp.]
MFLHRYNISLKRGTITTPYSLEYGELFCF